MGMCTCAWVLQGARGGHWIPLEQSSELTDKGARDESSYTGLSHLSSARLRFSFSCPLLSLQQIVTSLNSGLVLFTFTVFHTLFMRMSCLKHVILYGRNRSELNAFCTHTSSSLPELLPELLSGALSLLLNVFCS